MSFKFGTPAHIAAINTDNAWGAELARLFGAKAGDVRYTKEGRGAEGSDLRRLYDEREAADIAWHAECSQPRKEG